MTDTTNLSTEGADASDVNWQETATTLQEEVTRQAQEISDLKEQLQEATTKLANLPKSDAERVVPLAEYKQGDKVLALKNGDWLSGVVSERDKISNHLHVNTDRGPVTIASTRLIKREI